mgnify:CR=1 FL=1
MLPIVVPMGLLYTLAQFVILGRYSGAIHLVCLAGAVAFICLDAPARHRARRRIAIIAAAIGVSPFLGPGIVAPIVPGAAEPLPHLSIELLAVVVMPLYWIGTLLVGGIAGGFFYLFLGPDYLDVIFLDGNIVRPYMVAVFGLAAAAIAGLPFIIDGLRWVVQRFVSRQDAAGGTTAIPDEQ